MKRLTQNGTAVFERAFTLPGLHETLPAGAYRIETEVTATPWGDASGPARSMVRILLHPRASHPGMVRHLTLSVTALNEALAQDAATKPAHDRAFLDERMADPMVRLVMHADGLSETPLRHDPTNGSATADATPRRTMTQRAIQVAENEGMPLLAIKR
ncbi:hypothetical protein [Pararhodobacter zhoushanensis]|uniref:Uncharacterized protein n=1 Tax=Pararhodobacter zhoushanensis TaxID=2479545 RepID=A0ABT3GU08_9RHOB|nr:hypothetical protein [Pararhodobacter zhoushanensis]MCW1931021.1 hypothetical protein [Pararhodobacter zhoushanensis]